MGNLVFGKCMKAFAASVGHLLTHRGGGGGNFGLADRGGVLSGQPLGDLGGKRLEQLQLLVVEFAHLVVDQAERAQNHPVRLPDGGGRQRAGAAIGAVLGGVLGNQVARNERTLGTVAGAGLGAAAGSYIGCNQQRTRAIAQANASQFRANSNLRIRSGPGTGFRQAGSLSAGQPFTAVASQGDWVQIAGGGWVNANYVSRY